MSGSLWIAHCYAGGGGLLWSLRSLLLLLLSLSGIAKTLPVEDLAILIAMVENAIIACGALVLLPPFAVRNMPFSTISPFRTMTFEMSSARRTISFS